MSEPPPPPGAAETPATEIYAQVAGIPARRQPVVPLRLIRYTCGHDDLAEYTRSGAEVAAHLTMALYRYTGHAVGDFAHVLDFGCGAGRLLATMPFGKATVDACDIGDQAAAFAAAQFPWARVYRNATMPPLRYAEGQFGLIYAFSVFSHLTLDAETAWLQELGRVGSPGCVYLLTVHGDWMIQNVLDDRADEARRAGFYELHNYSRFSAFPRYYQSTFHTTEYTMAAWSQYFDVLAVIPGDDPARVAFDDTSRELARTLRPLGQDIVVAVKRSP